MDNSIFAFSTASLILIIALLSFDTSIPSFFLNSFTTYLCSFSSISSPPNWVSPAVDNTSTTPSPYSITVTSKVPPPRSRTQIFNNSSETLSNPYAKHAAVGSLIILTTSKPAISPAFLVAVR